MQWMFQRDKPAQRGFTLVELMIVIAIIGILSVVLVPKIGRAKDAAKIAGVEANMRTVMREITLMIDDYTDPGALKTAIVERLDNMLANPYNGSKRAYEYLGTLNPYDAAAVRVQFNANYTFGDLDTYFSKEYSEQRGHLQGTVVVCIGGKNFVLEGVKIYGFDGKGYSITTVDKALKVMK